MVFYHLFLFFLCITLLVKGVSYPNKPSVKTVWYMWVKGLWGGKSLLLNMGTNMLNILNVSLPLCQIPTARIDVLFPCSFHLIHLTDDSPAVVRQRSSSLLSWQLSWPLHKKLRSTQWPFRHLKRVPEHSEPAVVEAGQRSGSSVSSDRVTVTGFKLPVKHKPLCDVCSGAVFRSCFVYHFQHFHLIKLKIKYWAFHFNQDLKRSNSS